MLCHKIHLYSFDSITLMYSRKNVFFCGKTLYDKLGIFVLEHICLNAHC